MAPREGYESNFKPTFRQMGITWFVTYSAILVVMHHLILFYLEIFRLNDFFFTFFKVIVSSVLTLLLIMLTQAIFNAPRERS